MANFNATGKNELSNCQIWTQAWLNWYREPFTEVELEMLKQNPKAIFQMGPETSDFEYAFNRVFRDKDG